MNFYTDILRKIAENGIKNQVEKEGDFYNENGLLVCGKCGELRQCIKTYNPNGKDKITLKIAAQCKCEKEEQRKKEEAEKVEFIRHQIEKARRYSLMDSKFFEATFDRFETNEFNEKNLRICKRYVEVFDKMIESGQGLLMWGNVGTGKSFAAACIANELINARRSVVMTSFVRILEAIQKDDNTEEVMMHKLETAKLVIFDDLGAERNTSYALEKVYGIIDSRWRSGLPMILTTNLTIQEMKEETDTRFMRIYDRLFEVCLPMEFKGPSWRKKKAAQKFNEIGDLLKED